MKRPLSQNPATVARRERREEAAFRDALRRENEDMAAEIRVYQDQGMTLEEAFEKACGPTLFLIVDA